MLSILLQSTTPDTSNYMVGGYIVFFVVMALYLGSMVLRQRNLVQDLDLLEEVADSQGKN